MDTLWISKSVIPVTSPQHWSLSHTKPMLPVKLVSVLICRTRPFKAHVSLPLTVRSIPSHLHTSIGPATVPTLRLSEEEKHASTKCTPSSQHVLVFCYVCNRSAENRLDRGERRERSHCSIHIIANTKGKEKHALAVWYGRPALRFVLGGNNIEVRRKWADTGKGNPYA